LRQALTRNLESVESHIYLAATLARAGQRDDAAWELEQILMLDPAFRIREWLGNYPMTDTDQRERLTLAMESLK
jgi:hypothetical protein